MSVFHYKRNYNLLDILIVKKSVYKRIIILGIILRLGILVGSYFDLVQVPEPKITNSDLHGCPPSPRWLVLRRAGEAACPGTG